MTPIAHRSPVRFRAVCLAATVIGLAAAAPAFAQGFGFATFSAVVAPSGQTTRGLGVQSSSSPKKGTYIVEFTRPVSTCAYTASPLGKKGGQASVSAVPGQPKRIQVSTYKRTGKPGRLGFIVQVSCSS